MYLIEECVKCRARLLNEFQFLDKVLHELAIPKCKKVPSSAEGKTTQIPKWKQLPLTASMPALECKYMVIE